MVGDYGGGAVEQLLAGYPKTVLRPVMTVVTAVAIESVELIHEGLTLGEFPEQAEAPEQ